MKIVIFGTGGVGGYFGGRLAQSGEEVVLIARGEHLKTIREKGLVVESLKGDFRIQPALATDQITDIGPVDVVLITVKAWQVPDAASSLQPLLGPQTFVVPLENGVEAADQLIEAIGVERVVGGLCKIISYIAGPGKIKHAGAEPMVAFGELDHRKTERTEKLLQAFLKAGVTARIPDDIQEAIWEKFLFIASVSGIGAVTRAPIGILRSVSQIRETLKDAMREIYNVAIAKGVRLQESVIDKTMGFVDQLPFEGTASMQRDIVEGKPSELESQSGAVVRFGTQWNVPTPVHSFLYRFLLPAELKARGKVIW
jgi:2-dehydropantoate 2-reductase